MRTLVPLQLRLRNGGRCSVWCRAGTSDRYIVSEQNKDYRQLPLAGERVLDVGANIGTFAVYAYHAGAADVLAIEPEPANFRLLQKNVRGLANVVCEQSAVVEGSQPTVTLYVSSGPNSHSVVEKRCLRTLEVPARNFCRLLREYKPTALKLDIEGGEYALLADLRVLRESSVTSLSVELHCSKAWYRDRAVQIPRLLVEDGWKTVVAPIDIALRGRFGISGTWSR